MPMDAKEGMAINIAARKCLLLVQEEVKVNSAFARVLKKLSAIRQVLWRHCWHQRQIEGQQQWMT